MFTAGEELMVERHGKTKHRRQRSQGGTGK